MINIILTLLIILIIIICINTQTSSILMDVDATVPTFINSMLEDGNNLISPLQGLLASIFGLTIIAWLFNVIFLYNLLKLFILKENRNFIFNWINKIKNEYIKDKINKRFTKLLEVSSRFDLLFLILSFIAITICSIAILFICIYLIGNLDTISMDHILKYSEMSKNSNISNSLLPMLCLTNKLRLITANKFFIKTIM